MDDLKKARERIDEIDGKMAALFAERMASVDAVAAYKKAHNMKTYDEDREREVIEKNSLLIKNEWLRPYYVRFLKETMALSRDWQDNKSKGAGGAPALSDAAEVSVSLPGRTYTVTIGRGLLAKAQTIFDLHRRVFILTDSGVPIAYARQICDSAACATVFTVPSGEASKSPQMLERVLRAMMDFGMTRKDCLVTVGGGVVGDLGGLAAATYMRGVDFYQVPTTLLSQVDASVGGKCAVNLDNVKNIVGAFYQPKGVLIDPDTLATLPARHMASGFAEVIKMALTSDGALFAQLEKGVPTGNELCEVIAKAVDIKRRVVEADEREGGLRRILNFGHTLGHGIEAAEELRNLYHGECVALGMIPMCSPSVRARLLPVLAMFGLQIDYHFSAERIMPFVEHDKKQDADGTIIAVIVDEVGTYRMQRMTTAELSERVKDCKEI